MVTMKIIDRKVKHLDGGVVELYSKSYTIINRRVHYNTTVRELILARIMDIGNINTGHIVSSNSLQVRIDPPTYNNLRTDVIDALYDEEDKIDITKKSNTGPSDAMEEEWLRDRYWSGARMYIHRFIATSIEIGIHWNYDSYNADSKCSYLAFNHPFIAEAIERHNSVDYSLWFK